MIDGWRFETGTERDEKHLKQKLKIQNEIEQKIDL